jgi:hypothetical protein
MVIPKDIKSLNKNIEKSFPENILSSQRKTIHPALPENSPENKEFLTALKILNISR